MNARVTVMVSVAAALLWADGQAAPQYVVSDLVKPARPAFAALQFTLAQTTGPSKSAALVRSVARGGVIAIPGAVFAAGINSQAEVTGFLFTPEQRAFIYDKGLIEVLGTLGGDLSGGQDINSAGEVTGVSYTAEAGGEVFQHAFLYRQGVMHDIGTLGGKDSFGDGINSEGAITGWATLSGSITEGANRHAFVYRHGVMHDLGTLTGPDPLAQNESAGTSINSFGQVTGYSSVSASATLPIHAFVFSSGKMHDIGTLGGTASFGSGINDRGEVTGSSTVDDQADANFHAFLYSHGVMRDLGTLVGPDPQAQIQSSANSINVRGEVTGYSFLTSGPPDNAHPAHAFLYKDGVMTDLNSLINPSALPSGVVLTEGFAINNKGTVVASGSDGTVYLLTPSKP